MRNRSEILSRLSDPGIVAVIRTPDPQQVLPVCEALLEGGIVALEITLTVPGALTLIGEMSRRFGGNAMIGAGSVLNAQGARAAIDAGAEFIVSPICRKEIAAAAHEADRAVMLGAFTPTEAQSAHEMGADLIKIFPADKLGAGHIKALRAPMPHLRIVPTGGVNLDTIPEFMAAGCVALGVGSSLLKPQLLEQENWAGLTDLARQYVARISACKTD